MPRSRVKTSYTRAQSTPSARREPIHPAFIQPAKVPRGLSPLAQYLEDNADSGIPVTELVEQFQEYDCPHKDEYEISRNSSKTSFHCPSCGRVRTVEKPGA